MTGTAEIVAAVAGSTALGGAVTALGRWALQRARGQESEAVRLWAKWEAEVLKREALEADLQSARMELIEVHRLIVESTATVHEATAEHKVELAGLQRRLAASEAEHAGCDEALAKVRAELSAIRQNVRRVDKEQRRARRDSEPELMRAKRESEQ